MNGCIHPALHKALLIILTCLTSTAFPFRNKESLSVYIAVPNRSSVRISAIDRKARRRSGNLNSATHSEKDRDRSLSVPELHFFYFAVPRCIYQQCLFFFLWCDSAAWFMMWHCADLSLISMPCFRTCCSIINIMFSVFNRESVALILGMINLNIFKQETWCQGVCCTHKSWSAPWCMEVLQGGLDGGFSFFPHLLNLQSILEQKI